MLLLFFEKVLVVVQLHDQSLAGTCVEYIYNAGLYHFMETYWIVSAVVEYF